MPDWTLNIDGRDYEPLPESWVEHGIDQDGVGPQLLAVSAGSFRNTIRVRYAHPTGTRVGQMFFPGTEAGNGLVPELLVHGQWPRSIAASRLEPVGDIRLEERHYLGELWDDRVDDVLDGDLDVDLDDARLVADGGDVIEDREGGKMGYQDFCDACEGKIGTADYFCRWCGTSLRDGNRLSGGESDD